MPDRKDKILRILASEQLKPSQNVINMCDKIKTRHEGRVQAFVYYGSSLRAMNDPEKMLDFYVLVDSYRKTHKSPLRVVINSMLPPSVYYMENANADGSISNCKYSIISLPAFEKKCSGKAFLSVVWGRFSQPCVLLFPKSESIKSRIQLARSRGIRHVANQTAPLFTGKTDAIKFWARGFMESYKTELRPESSEARSEEIVARYEKRYGALMETIYGKPDVQNLFAMPVASSFNQMLCKLKWFGRRLLGKPVAAIRILSSAVTFDGGLDYVLHKLKNHSGVTIPVTEGQRRHPILWSPVLAWRLYRKGAFK
ncbi:MAG: hypothetical protein EX271_03315 [Acidimicrobiales bacterium]|nr:hypothetical protein [Hyphomonadaceae bacterium]RZV43731.1 MAG: hypothetical protein EX271_03315 [Acidimicrobiales bacterium]